MPNYFLELPLIERSEILSKLSTLPEVNRSETILEKDLWICWALETLFNMPDRLSMACKVGASLSKVFNVIHRFSEDIDLTISYDEFCDKDIFASTISRAQLKKITQDIKIKVAKHINDIIIPYFNEIISLQFKNKNLKIISGDDGETIYIEYQSTASNKDNYITGNIKLEFGGRNIITPNSLHEITADVQPYLKELVFPVPKIPVLSAEKTFWEKMTLIHYECHRDKIKMNANRISRHWYDIAKLYKDPIGQSAIKKIELLHSVIQIKKAFYHASYANYDACLNGGFKLIPSEAGLRQLKVDFNKMIDNQMFYNEEIQFVEVINQIRELEEIINSTVK